MRSTRSLLFCVVLAVSGWASAETPPQPVAEAPNPQPKAEPAKKEEAKKEEKCEHGVKKGICTRCNPKLAAVYKSKGDWCEEHQRAESQCVPCNPELAKKGMK